MAGAAAAASISAGAHSCRFRLQEEGWSSWSGPTLETHDSEGLTLLLFNRSEAARSSATGGVRTRVAVWNVRGQRSRLALPRPISFPTDLISQAFSPWLISCSLRLGGCFSVNQGPERATSLPFLPPSFWGPPQLGWHTLITAEKGERVPDFSNLSLSIFTAKVTRASRPPSRRRDVRLLA